MQTVHPSMELATLAQLDVIDVRPDGACVLNEAFASACRQAFADDPRRFDEIVPTVIFARALARGLVHGLDVEALALAALEVGAAQVDA
jgi:hypothetical protein